VTNAEGRKKTRAERLSMPLARDVVKDLAVEHGACVRPIQLRRTDLATGQTEPGRRVLVSRKWSGKTLADHRADRKNWLMETLGLPATDPARYAWEPVNPGDQDHMPTARRLLHVVADRIRWQQALDQARRRAAGEPPDDFSATGRAA
jgi:hypothetical protein